MELKALPQHLHMIGRVGLTIQEFRMTYANVNAFVAKLIAARSATAYEPLPNPAAELPRRAAFLSDRQTEQPHLEEALLIRRFVRDLIGTRQPNFVGRNLLSKLVCECRLLALECLHGVFYTWENQNPAEQARVYSSAPIIYDFTSAMLTIVSQEDLDDSFFRRFHEGLGNIELELTILDEDQDSVLDMCALVRGVYHSVALAYNKAFGYIAPDADCAAIDFCLHSQGKRIETRGSQIEFKEATLN